MTIVGSSVGAQAMAYRAQVAETVEAPAEASASYGGWRAEDSLARVAGARAEVWRRERGYERDEDFAFEFSTWEEAVAVAGQHLADAWLAVRVSQQDELLPAAARLIVPDERPPLTRKRKGVPLEAGVRLHEKVLDQPDSIQRQVLALQKIFLSVGALKPPGLMTEALKRDWLMPGSQAGRTGRTHTAIAPMGVSETRGCVVTFWHQGRSSFPGLRRTVVWPPTGCHLIQSVQSSC